jgi:hypothetical protein
MIDDPARRVIASRFVSLGADEMTVRRNFRQFPEQSTSRDLPQFPIDGRDVTEEEPFLSRRDPLALEDVEYVSRGGGLKTDDIGNPGIAKAYSDFFVEDGYAGDVIVNLLQDSLLEKATVRVQGFVRLSWTHKDYAQ